jgi:iron complex outermembrane receptor protein
LIPKLLLAVLSTLCTIGNVYAQHTSITGKIKTIAGNSITGATILLYRYADSSLIKTAISDSKGKYEISQVKAGLYFISGSFIGYATTSTTVFSVIDDAKIIAPPLFLKMAEKRMQEITVTGTYQKPMIEVTADKIVFNIENSINASGSNAFELLQKSPGVTTDKDDNLNIKGKNGVRIYIDGKATEMQPSDFAAYLKSINSLDIASIEIISNPSARYDAAGNAGIINIKLKKNNTFGFSGSASAGLNIATNAKTNGSLSLNYRNNKVNLFSNYSNNRSNNDNTFNLYRVQNDTLYNQENLQNIKGWTHNLKAGADFIVSKKSTLGFIFTGNFTDNTVNSISRTPSSSINTGIIDGILYARNTIPGNTNNQNFNGNYRYADTSGHELNIDIDHGFYKSRKTSYQPNAYYTSSPETLLYEKIYRNSTPANITINTQKIDYETPFKKGKLYVGAKPGHVKTDNAFTLYEVSNGYNSLDSSRSNSFSYNENINAGYLSYFTPLGKKINLQAGIRVENTSSKSILTRTNGLPQPDDRIDRNYTDLFPSAAFTYIASVNNSFNLSYSRRIDRPNYNDLNPFEVRVDELTYIKGNAFLRPQYTNNLQLTHTFKFRYITTIGYSHIKDYSAYILDSTEKTRTFISKMNLASQNVANINFFVPVNITKWWNVYSSLNVYNSQYNANFGPYKSININVTSFSFHTQNSFKLGNGFTGELSGFYNSPSVSAGTFKNKGLGSIDLGIQKQLFHNKATAHLSFTDLLHTLQWKAESNYGGTHILANNSYESRQLRMSFTYHFGSTKVKQVVPLTTGNEEEKKRSSAEGGFGN